MTADKIVYIGDNISNAKITLSEKDLSNHVMQIGSTGRGKSSMIEAEAKRRGISYEEVEREWEPSLEEKQREELREQAARVKSDLRITAVREAYWNATAPEFSEFDSMFDTLNEFYDKEVTIDHVRKLFNMIPGDLIGEGVKWGFSDSGVRDSVFEFVEENKNIVGTEVFGDLS